MRTKEEHSPDVGCGTTNDPDRTNDNTVEEGATNHIPFVCRPPRYKWVGCYRGGGVCDDFVTVVAVNQAPRGVDVSELRSPSRTNGLDGFGY